MSARRWPVGVGWPVWVMCWSLVVALGCGAMYPEVRAPVRPFPSAWTPEPPPPEEVVYLEFVEAYIPKRTRDGREWGTRGPASFGKIVVDGREILVPPVNSGSFQPTWPEQRRANYRIRRGADVRIELWDARTIKNRPICLKQLGSLHDEVSPAPVEFVCEETGGLGYEHVVEAVGSSQSWATSLGIARPGGTVGPLLFPAPPLLFGP